MSIHRTHQHCCSQVKLVEELCDKDVHLKHIGNILAFNVAQHVNEPLKLAMCWADPEEVHLMRREKGSVVIYGVISSSLTTSVFLDF